MKTLYDFDQLIDQAIIQLQSQREYTDSESRMLRQVIRDSLSKYNETIQIGKDAYLHWGDAYEIDIIFRNIDEALKQLKQSHASTHGLLKETEYQYLLNVAIRAFERNALDETKSMLSILAILDPLHMEHYILLATIVWVQEGVEVASKVYDQFVKIFKDPVLYFYAADCFVHAENTHRAGKLLNEALELCKLMHGKHAADVQHSIETYRAQLHYER